MQYLLTSFLLISFLNLGCAQNRANVFIEPAQQFVLGEYKNDPYTANLRNAGKVSVTVEVVTKADGTVQESSELQPGQSLRRKVTPETQLHFRNTSTQKAQVVARLSENVPGMRYLELNDDRYQTTEQTSTKSPKQSDTSGSDTPTKIDYNYTQSTTIPVGETAVFAPEQPMSHSAIISNRGRLEVQIRHRDTGQVTQSFGTGQRSKNTVFLGSHEVLTLLNTSKGSVKVSLALSENLEDFVLRSDRM